MLQNIYVIFVLLLVAGLTIVFFSHYFLYYSLVRFFQINNSKTKTVLVIVFLILPLSFIVSSIINRWIENSFTSIFYFASGLWLGLAVNLLTAFGLAWILVVILKLLSWRTNLRIMGAMAIVLAFLYAGYGIWNAYHPRIKNITVKIKNLPDNWRGKKAVQLSDIHLGRVLEEKFLQGIVTQVNSINPDIIFITGDLFDGMDGRLDTLIEPINALRAPLGIYFITGNHETYLGVERTYEALEKTNVRILDDEMTTIKGLQIIGVSYPERSISKDVAAAIKKNPDFNPQLASILLYHDPVQIKQIKETGINLQLSGHTHQGQLFPFMFISKLIYKKYYNGLHQEGDYSIYTSSGVGVWGPTMRTGNQPEINVITLE